MRRRDHPVALAPDQHGRPGSEAGQAILRADRLAVDIDDAPTGGQERAPGIGVGQRRQGSPRLVRAGADRRQTQFRPDIQGRVAHHVHPPGGDQRQHELAAGQGGGPQQRIQFTAEAAAADQHQGIDPVREQIGHLQRNAAAQRMADHGRVGDTEGVEHVPQAGRIGAERIVAGGFGRVAVTVEVRCDHPMVAGESVNLCRPGGRRAHQAVHEDDRCA